MRGRGGSFQLPIIGCMNQPPRLCQPRRLRDILLVGTATPPLLRRGVRTSIRDRNSETPPLSAVPHRGYTHTAAAGLVAGALELAAEPGPAVLRPLVAHQGVARTEAQQRHVQERLP